MRAQSLLRRPAVTMEGVRAASGQIRSVVKRHRGTGHVLVFGSVARGDADADSDLDLLVEFEPEASYFDLLAVEAELSELLGVHVDVISLGSRGRAAESARSQAVALT